MNSSGQPLRYDGEREWLEGLRYEDKFGETGLPLPYPGDWKLHVKDPGPSCFPTDGGPRQALEHVEIAS